MERAAAAVDADVEATPVVDRGHHRRLRGGNGRDVGGRGGGGDARGDPAGCGDQKFLHVKSQPLVNLCPSPQPAITAMTERPVAGRKQKGRHAAGLFVQLDRIHFAIADRVIGISQLS
jgi:hypothetical protein